MPFQWYFYDAGYILYIIPFMLLAFAAQIYIKSTYAKFSRVRNSTGLTGEQVARYILDKNGLQHVRVKQVAGTLSDHYDPRTQVVSLSSGVYQSNSISAASIAAHEVGHAIQHSTNYLPLKIRASLVPVVTISSSFMWIFIFAGFLFNYSNLVNIGILIFAASVLFQIVTLPVEFNASTRAIKQLQQYNLVSPNEISGSKKVLTAAAFTYIAATIVAIAQLLRLIAVSGNRNSRD